MEASKWLKTEIGTDIWEKKYQFASESFDEWIDRVANGDEDIKNAIIKKQFLYAGRILANRQLDKHGKKITYSNCFFVKPPEDNIESIFDTGKSLARTYSASGGAGTDISLLRPNRSKVNNSAETTTGSISFADFFSFITGLIGQKGRRGALLVSIMCTHPDVMEFVTAKTDLNAITKANLSIKITDAFMDAVIDNADWELCFNVPETEQTIRKTIKAQDLYNLICETNWDYGEPAMLFWDTITNNNIMSEDETFVLGGVNPCGEQPLPDGGSCLLGSINLSEFVKSPFSNRAEFKFKELEEMVEQAIKGLNDVLMEGMHLLPLEEQKISVNKYRQIGLGVMGIADMFIKMGMRYGDDASFNLSDQIGFLMANTALKTSASIAKEKGAFPECKIEAILTSDWVKNNSTVETLELIKQYGLANSQLLTCAPTGSISTMLGISGGIEPIYNYSYTRKSESLSATGDKYYKIYTPIVEQYMKAKNIFNESELPDFFTNAMTMDYMDRIKMQAIWQSHIDASISSTVNLPNSATVQDVKNIYMEAWKHGLKGITVFRDGCKRVGILTSEGKSQTIEDIDGYKKVVKSIQDLKWGTTLAVSDDLIGIKKKYRSSIGTMYVEGWVDPDNGRLTEIYIHNNNSEYNPLLDALSRIASAGLRTGVRFEYLIHQLKRVDISQKATENIPKEIANILQDMQEKTYEEFGFDIEIEEYQEPEIPTYLEEYNPSECPMCHSSLQHTNGCTKCSNPECVFEVCG